MDQELINMLMPYLLQGAGGAVLGPLIGSLLGGKNFSFIGKVLAGIIGGVGVGQGLDAAGVLPQIMASLPEGLVGQLIANLAAGGLGGGVLSGLAGLIFGRK